MNSDFAMAAINPPVNAEFQVLKFGRSGSPRSISLQISNGDLVWRSKQLSLKFGKINRVFAKSISKIEKGQLTAQFERFPQYHPDGWKLRSLVVFYNDTNGNLSSLNIIATTDDEFTHLFETLHKLMADKLSTRAAMPPDLLYIQDMWDKADADRSGSLSKSEVLQVVEKMNIHIPANQLKEKFDLVDVNKSGQLDSEEFTRFIQLLEDRKEMHILWQRIVAKETPDSPLDISEKDDGDFIHQVISVEQFLNFWSANQDNSVDTSNAWDKLAACTGERLDKRVPQITYKMFLKIMTSGFNDVFDPAKQLVHMDMTRPLSHYWVASSHNTYLEGDQLKSNSSVNRYVSDLLSGCRCVELDCWDGDDGKPIIYHGHTLTSKIRFKDVIEAIRDHGFTNSSFPVILSIENHLCYEQQQVAATTIKETLGDKLAIPLATPGARLPSPQQLANKVLIKGKKLSASAAHAEEDDDDDDDDLDGGRGNRKEKHKASKHKGTHPDLSAITYLGTGKVKDFPADGNASIPCDSMCSFSEHATLKYLHHTDTTEGWILHNEMHLSRIYPAGARVDSSNYDPAPAWSAGNHLVALNYQTSDIPMHVNRGRFRENGKSGYVLKPAYMTNPSEVAKHAGHKKLSVTVLSGQHLPKPSGSEHGLIVNPFVSISVHGEKKEGRSVRTKAVHDNGFNPIWNETFEFDIIDPEVAVVNFEVSSEYFGGSSVFFIAFASMPFSCMRTGVRHCPLFNGVGDRLGDFAYASLCLIVHIKDA